MFDTLQDRLSTAFKNLSSKGRITEADINETTREIRIALLEADVNLGVVKEFIAAVKEQCLGAEVHKALNPSQQIIKIVNDELINILGGDARAIRFAKRPPTVIMLAGLQGAGKTTLAGKLAKWLKGEGHTPLLVAADLQRPNAVNQLQVVGERAGVHVFAPEPGNGIGDPVQVAKDSIDHAQQKLYDTVIVDTAGRLGVDAEMMQQAVDIKAATNPDEVLFVVDAMIGQDAVNTANAFADGVGFDGVVLTKLDGDARGGAALSIAKVVGKPIMFASNGEGLEDFDRFHPDRMASRILGMGDVLTLIETAQKTFDEEKSRVATEKLLRGKGEFTMDDFLDQLQQVRKMGPMSKLLAMMPGVPKEAINQVDEKEIDRMQAIMYSMTPAERLDVTILNGSRRLRIANGAGVQVSDVNQLVNKFLEARKMVQQMAPMMGGMPGMGGMGQARKPKKGRKKKSGQKVSGNAAKRRAARQAQQQQRPAANPAAFGAQPDVNQAMQGFELPPELQKMFEQQNKGPLG